MLQATGAGPVDGHPKYLSSFRAEQSGIVAVLYLIQRICMHFTIKNGAVKFHCDNKGALHNVFEKRLVGIMPYFTTDHDLVELA
jgi:hypothetical protein